MPDMKDAKQQTGMGRIMVKLEDLQALSVELRRKAWEISPPPLKGQPDEETSEASDCASVKITNWLKITNYWLDGSLSALREARDALNEFI